MARVELLVARRYLRARRQVGLVTWISAIAATGVTVGVAALICTLAVFSGFSSIITALLVGFDPHLRIEARDGGLLRDPHTVMARLAADPAVRGAAPFVTGRVVAVNDQRTKVVVVRGVDGRIGDVSGVRSTMVGGAFALGDTAGLQGIVTGTILADRLALTLGDTVTLVSPAGLEASITQLAQPRTMRCILTGTYASLNKEYDANDVYLDLPAAQRLLDVAGGVNGVEARLDDLHHADAERDKLQAAFQAAGEPVRVVTWYDLHRDLYSVMAVERRIAFLLLSLIIVVAGFTILGSLTMTVIEKQRDISLLKAVGATDRQIGRIFLLAGALVGVAGAAAGSVLGYAACVAQETYHLFTLNSSVYIIGALPVRMHLEDFVLVDLAAIALSTLAALYPARRAARVVAAEGLRWE